MTYSYEYTKHETRTNDSAALEGVEVLDQLLETDDGDFVMTADGDICIANDVEAQAQLLAHCIRTHYDSSPSFPNFGSRLRNSLGLTDSDYVLEEMERLLLEDLEKSGLIIDQVEVLPTPQELIIIHVSSIADSGNVVEGVYRMNTETGWIELQGGTQV